MGRFADMSREELLANVDRALAAYRALSYPKKFKIIRELTNGQLYCQNRDDGSYLILNDWRGKESKK